MAGRSPRRSAARPTRLSTSDAPGETRIQVANQLSLIFPSESLIADRARISTYAALREAFTLLDRFMGQASAFGDYCEACILPDRDGVFDQDEAAAGFWHFCNLIGLPSSDRMPHGEFVNALVAAGFAQGRSPGGRFFHRGGRLVDKFGGAVRLADVMPVGIFIAEICAIGPEFRVKAAEIREAYGEFALSRGTQPLPPIKFSKALMSLGFRRIHSDGHIYCGVKLAKPASSNGRRGK